LRLGFRTPECRIVDAFAGVARANCVHTPTLERPGEFVNG